MCIRDRCHILYSLIKYTVSVYICCNIYPLQVGSCEKYYFRNCLLNSDGNALHNIEHYSVVFMTCSSERACNLLVHMDVHFPANWMWLNDIYRRCSNLGAIFSWGVHSCVNNTWYCTHQKRTMHIWHAKSATYVLVARLSQLVHCIFMFSFYETQISGIRIR